MNHRYRSSPRAQRLSAGRGVVQSSRARSLGADHSLLPPPAGVVEDWTAVRVFLRGKVGHMEVGHPGPRQST